MESEGRQDRPYVAHHDSPDEPDDEEAWRDAEALAQAERDSMRQRHLARWRVVRYLAGVFLACVSIAGGAVAVMAVVAALRSGTGPASLVTDADGSRVRFATLTSGQLLMLAGAIVALEASLLESLRIRGLRVRRGE